MSSRQHTGFYYKNYQGEGEEEEEVIIFSYIDIFTIAFGALLLSLVLHEPISNDRIERRDMSFMKVLSSQME